MSKFFQPSYDDFLEGAAPQRFVTRYKKECQDLACSSGNIGEITTDFGKDPAIADIATTTEGNTTDYGNVPTELDWSSRVEAMIFNVEIEGNTAGNMTVDLEFYRAVYGDTGGVEDWQRIDLGGSEYGLGDGSEVVVQTDRSRVFVRIAGYTNPDSSAELYVSCMMGAEHDIDVDEGVHPSGMWGWISSLGRWGKIATDSAGALSISGWAAFVTLLTTISTACASILSDTTAILDDTADIETATETSATAIGAHGSATDTPGVRVLGKAEATTPTPVADGQDVGFWLNLLGAIGVFQTMGLDETNDHVSTYEKPGSGIDSVIKDCAAADTAYALVAASTPCIGVFLSGAQANAGQARFGDSAIAAVATGGAYIPHDDVGAPVWVSIDDAAKIYVSASNNGDDVLATIITR